MSKETIAPIIIATLCSIKLVWEVATLIRDWKNGKL